MEFQLLGGNFHLASPFIAIAVGVAFILLFWIIMAREKRIGYSYLDLWRKKTTGQILFSRRIFVPFFLGLMFLLLAIADPQVINIKEQSLQVRDFVVVLDESGSMRIAMGKTPDDLLPNSFEKTRLGVAEKKLKKFFQQRPGDRFALILYDHQPGIVRGFNNDFAQIESALLPRETIISQIKHEQNQLGYGGGTNTSKAVRLAIDYFKRASLAKNKALILISDFDDNPYEMFGVMKQTRLEGINIYLVGVDTQREGSNFSRFKKQLRDEGIRLFAAEKESDLDIAFQLIDKLEKSEMKQNIIVSQSIGWVFVALAAISLISFILLSEKSKKLP